MYPIELTVINYHLSDNNTQYDVMITSYIKSKTTA